jgi:Holliday junction DNA helicase RuvA
MFEYIRGKLIEITPTKITIEANNIGYNILIPISVFSSLPEKNSEILCYTFLVIKEDSHTLYGFLEKEEKELFKLLITVSGIGPKIALLIIGNIEFSNFQRALKNSDIGVICKIPGIGKKTAERLIIELRDKIKIVGGDFSNSLEKEEKLYIFDAVNALVNLGYNHIQAQKVVKKAAEKNKGEKDVGRLISLALKSL